MRAPQQRIPRQRRRGVATAGGVGLLALATLLLARQRGGHDLAAATATEAPAETKPALSAEALLPPTIESPPTRYQLRAGAGSEAAGELSAEAAGFTSQRTPGDWLLQYSKRWRKINGWQPSGKLRWNPAGSIGSMRWSRNLMKGDSVDTPVDGSGLELHLETSVERPSLAAQQQMQEQSLKLVCQQRAEVIVGPRAQAKYLNLTLPVGVLVGVACSAPAVQDSARRTREGTIADLGPLTAYARLTMPGIQELRGWACEADVEDSWLGLVRAKILSPWARKSPGGQWSLEHLRTHGAVGVPRALADAAAGIAAASSAALEKLRDPSGLPPSTYENAAVVPTTRLRAGSGGPGAAVMLESSQAGLGGAGWGTSAEVSRVGWGARLSVAGGANKGYGQPQYSLTAQALWDQAAALTHELKWMLTDGQGVWFTVRNGTKGPRLNMGLEIR